MFLLFTIFLLPSASPVKQQWSSLRGFLGKKQHYTSCTRIFAPSSHYYHALPVFPRSGKRAIRVLRRVSSGGKGEFAKGKKGWFTPSSVHWRWLLYEKKERFYSPFPPFPPFLLPSPHASHLHMKNKSPFSPAAFTAGPSEVL